MSVSIASAQKFEVKPVAEKKIKQLPAGPLFWRIDNFPTLAQAQAAAGPTGLAAEVAGKVWLFTLGPKGGSSNLAARTGNTAIALIYSYRVAQSSNYKASQNSPSYRECWPT